MLLSMFLDFAHSAEVGNAKELNCVSSSQEAWVGVT